MSFSGREQPGGGEGKGASPSRRRLLEPLAPSRKNFRPATEIAYYASKRTRKMEGGGGREWAPYMYRVGDPSAHDPGFRHELYFYKNLAYIEVFMV